MMLADQQAQLTRLVQIRQRRIDRAVSLLRQRLIDLEKHQADCAHCETLISLLNSEHRELRLAKSQCNMASAADWKHQENYGMVLQDRILDHRNRLVVLEKDVKNAEQAVEQAKIQLRIMRQKLQALSAQADQYGDQLGREKSRKEQRWQDEQAQGITSNAWME